MASQEVPSKREIADYLDNTEFAGEDIPTKIEDDQEDAELKAIGRRDAGVAAS
jgi:hypothetical protein